MMFPDEPYVLKLLFVKIRVLCNLLDHLGTDCVMPAYRCINTNVFVCYNLIVVKHVFQTS